ncbi:GTA-gp10 family protein [Pelagimonas varians]|uniref:Uncharacterized protein n=1 Tax=Pelagimonas varians TaxID=696760 RepID=A0A238K1B4_9RHOB|nr:GTA-gp10 family protein [Pelagimonas varians]PYG33122.1 tail tube GTA-gp10-like protein [Pelagimonas varians]SMX35746.1 hypothetical protein PEV8663_00579 [Pelagimonas varians]
MAQKTKAMFAEVTAKVDGEDMTLRIDFNALAEFEEKTGQKALEAIDEIESGAISMVTLRHFVWAGLQYHHPGCTVAKAGDFLSADPDALGRAFETALPKGEEDAPNGSEPEGDAGNAERAAG